MGPAGPIRYRSDGHVIISQPQVFSFQAGCCIVTVPFETLWIGEYRFVHDPIDVQLGARRLGQVVQEAQAAV